MSALSLRRESGASRRTRRGFTLIELLVVVAIIALLVSILVPSLTRVKELMRRTKCRGNLYSLGRSWLMYWTENNSAFPGISTDDSVGQTSLYIVYSGRRVNTWYLYDSQLINSEEAFACPTTVMNTPDPWFDDWHGAYPPWRSPNPWPPFKRRSDGTTYRHCRMTYCTRRMNYYEDKTIAPSLHRSKPLLLRNTGVDNVRSPSDFSFMADAFTHANLAKMNHYPDGVNVLYMNGNVSLFKNPGEPDGPNDVIYEGSGIGPSQTSNNNWAYDSVWMNIDDQN